VGALQSENKFYNVLSPDLKNKLCFTLLSKYYKKFYYFFNDLELQNFADPVFIRKVLSNFDMQIFPKGSYIMEAGKTFHYLFFLYKGAARVSNPYLGINIVDLPEESFFGDYQLLIGLTAVYDY